MNEHDFNKFLNAFIVALFWSSHMDDDDDAYTFDEKCKSDIASETMKRIEADCCQFFDDNRDDIAEHIVQAGHDYALTRNGHGVGFWDCDRRRIYGEAAAGRLDKASKKAGECTIYIGDDGQVYW